ncbi:metallophosphoesterase family protein [Hyphomicrobium zavarzinii]|uniref:metallophosphoesterase family protein n=1 Tax=Hyphomicrobium zavarzinii TaxID=48292 RepID=UPI00036E5253|nr:metallophosphoesterase family protein [Hyphomicrobium zavarzinii]
MISRFFGKKPEVRSLHQAQLPEGLRVYAIGDIHGCAHLLDRLHDQIEMDLQSRPPADVRLIYLGDYIDRGPDSAGVLERLSLPSPEGIGRVLLKGNHEDMLGSFLADPNVGSSWRQLGGLETLLSYRIDVNEVLGRVGFGGLADELRKRMPPSHVRMLSELQTSVSFGDYFFCHAGVRPGVSLERQDPRDLMWIRHEFLGSTQDFGKTVVHGHSPVERPDVRPNRIDIDTGAYATGHLTALVLEGAERRFLTT